MIGALVSVAEIFGSVVTWLWKTAAIVCNAHIELGIAKADIAELKTDVREVPDGHIRADTLISTITARLAQLDQLPSIASTLEAVRTTLERLDRVVIQRGSRGTTIRHRLAALSSLFQ
jgi:hypothetical protein